MIDAPSSATRIVRFGPFELDLRSGELRKNGSRVGLQDQPLQILSVLLQHPGELVTREELRQRLWPADTYVDFEQGLNAAVKRLRQALGDSADTPRFIETLPRRGYRFVAEVGSPGRPVSAPTTSRSRSARSVLAGSVAGLTAVLAVSAWVSNSRRSPETKSPPRISSLAVLPLKNLTGDPAQEYFADGMTDALSATFSQLGGLTVVSSTSSRRYRDTSRPAPQIAQELGVDALFEGTVLRSGNRVRVNGALVHGATGRRLWAQTYDRDLGDVLALYGEIAQTAAREMSVALPDSQRDRLARSGTVNAQAYDEYLRAMYLMNRWFGGGCRKAEGHLLRAIELDPQFAQAHAALVWCYVFPARMQRPVAELAPKARALTARALELDPTLASAHLGLGLIRQFIDYDWDEAERAFRRAVELDPGSALAHNAYGDLLYMRGRAGESVAMHRRAIRLDPYSPNHSVGFGYGLMNLRRYDDALKQLRSALELDPSDATAQFVLANTLELTGDSDGALTAYLTWLEEILLPQRVRGARVALEGAYRRSGWQGFWRRELELARDEALFPGTVYKPEGARFVGTTFMALRYARLGQRDAAMGLLERAYEERQHLVASLNSNPLWDGMRGDPRFQALIRRVGLEPVATIP